MDWETLKSRIVVDNGLFSLGQEVLTERVDRWLQRFFANDPLRMDQASKEEGADSVVVCGRLSLFNVETADTVVTFSLDKDGDVTIIVRMKLDPATWTFEKSFPNIPGGEQNPLSSIQYSECCLILTDQYIADYEGHELYEGINFSGVISASPLMDRLARAWGVYPVVYGHINLDRMIKPEELSWGEFPFLHDSADDQLPGYVLTVELKDYSSFEITNDVVVNGLGMRIYCPPTREFSDDNPTYTPVWAFHGNLESKGLDIGEECWVNYTPDAAAFQIVIDPKNASLDNLAKLAFLYEDKNVSDFLPDLLKPIGKLSITKFGIGFCLPSAVPSLEEVSITIEMPDTTWEVLDGQCTVGDLSCTFVYDATAGDDENKFGVSVSGVVGIKGQDFLVRAEKYDSFTLYLSTKNELDIPLGDFLKSFWPSLEAPMVLTVNQASCAICPTNYVSVAITMASDGHEWIIPIGDNKLVFSDLSMCFRYLRSKSDTDEDTNYSGCFMGTVTLFEDLKLKASVAYPAKSLSLHMSLPDFSFKEFIGNIYDGDSFLPESFDFTLTQSTIVLEKEGDNYHLKLATLVDGFGFMALDLLNGSQGKGVIFGINIDGNKLGDFFGLGDLSEFNKVFHLDKLVLIASTTELTNYSFPDADEFDVPAFKKLEVHNPNGGHLLPGLNFMATWTIDASNSTQNMLGKLLNLDFTAAMAIVLQIGTNNVYKLFAAMDAEICKHKIHGEIGAAYSDGKISFYVSGDLEVTIQDNPVEFHLEVGVTTGGAYGSGTMIASKSIDFGCFKIQQLALQIGVSWEGVPSFGVAGSITAGDRFNSSIAVLFDSEDPTRSMVAGSVSDVSLADIFDVFLPEDCESKRLAEESINDVREVLGWFRLSGTNSFDISTDLIDALDNVDLKAISDELAKYDVSIPTDISQVYYSIGKPGESWFIAALEPGKPRYYEIFRETDSASGTDVLRVSTEAQIYVVPQNTRIGALEYTQGFYLNGKLSIKDFFLEAEVDIRQDYFKVHARMSKVELGYGMLCLAGVNDDRTGPSDQGPELLVCTNKQPYGYVDAYISFLGFKSLWQGVVNEKGFSVSFHIDGLLASTDVKSTLLDSNHFSATLGMEIEPFLFKAIELVGHAFDLNLKTCAGAEVSVELDKEAGVQIGATISFTLLGTTYSISATLSIIPKDIEELANALLDEIKKYILDLLKDPDLFAKLVLSDIIKGVENLEKALVDIYNKTVEEAKKIIDVANEFLKKACSVNTAVDKLPGDSED